MIIEKQIIENGIYGFAVADALGVPYEFMSRKRMERFPCTAMTGGGAHQQPEGTWSDDTSLVLATLDGLTKIQNTDDLSPLMDCFSAWLNEDKYTVDGVFDVGGTTARAIKAYRQGVAPLECGGKQQTDNGNGSLMRILPAVFFSLIKGGEINYELLDDVSALTHGHIISQVACRIYADIVLAILQNTDKKDVLENINIHGIAEFSRLKSADFSILPESLIKSTGYVIDTLEAAVWCFLNTENYESCVLKAVNLGNDTDTVAAVAGSLAGLYYGKQSIPAEWLQALRGKDLIEALINDFYSLNEL